MKIFACLEACSPERLRLAILHEDLCLPRGVSPARLRIAILYEAPRDFASRSSMKIFACLEACSAARLRLAILYEDLCLPRGVQRRATSPRDPR
eukprot:tig00021312_g20059.t1